MRLLLLNVDGDDMKMKKWKKRRRKSANK